jgi:hypothetical protein
MDYIKFKNFWELKKNMTKQRKLLIATLVLGLFVLSPKIYKKGRKITNNIRKIMCVHENGFWTDRYATHFFDEGLSTSLKDFFENESSSSCVDFGCGAYGYYVKYFKDHNLNFEGFDGNPHAPKLSNGLVKVMDLSQDFNLKKKYDWVISLEVAEHIPKQFESTYLNNLIKHCEKGIIISWALVGQKGIGHVNCQNNDYVKAVFEQKGFINDLEAEKDLRINAGHTWFKNTVMVFRKQDSKKI